MKKTIVLIAFITQCFTANAWRIEYGGNVVISQPVYDDLYVAGGNITINAPIYGDLIVAGGTIIINDTISGDILMAGGNITVNGFTGDDIRCAGGNIRISKSIAGDLVITGGTVVIDKSVTIGGVLAGGGDVTIDGNITGNIKGGFGRLQLNGNVSKDIDCRGGKITVNGTIGGKSVLAARTIKLGANAAFNSDVRYWNKKGSLEFGQSLKNNSKAVYDSSLRVRYGQWYYLGATTVFGLLWYLGMALLMIVIVQYLFSATMKRAANTVFNSTLKSLGLGFLFFIAIPVAAVVAFITLIGLPVGLLLIFSYITLILLATVIIAVIAANWINNRYDKNWKSWRLGFAAFGIFVLLKLISFTPFVGWVIIILLACMAFGSILMNINWRRKHAVVAGGEERKQ